MCQPGRPAPHGESHAGSAGLDAFQSAKSHGARLSPAPAESAPSPSSVAPALPTFSGTSLPYAWCGFAAYATVSK